jgi:predicted branched-subunit amino acid permease
MRYHHGTAFQASLPFMSRYFSRPDFVSGIRDMTPPLIGIFPFGLVCGVSAQVAGLSIIEALGMAMIVFSGAAQILPRSSLRRRRRSP